jgi:DNA-binding CsgD family transcriptional regulator
MMQSITRISLFPHEYLNAIRPSSTGRKHLGFSASRELSKSEVEGAVFNAVREGYDTDREIGQLLGRSDNGIRIHLNTLAEKGKIRSTQSNPWVKRKYYPA